MLCICCKRCFKQEKKSKDVEHAKKYESDRTEYTDETKQRRYSKTKEKAKKIKQKIPQRQIQHTSSSDIDSRKIEPKITMKSIKHGYLEEGKIIYPY